MPATSRTAGTVKEGDERGEREGRAHHTLAARDPGNRRSAQRMHGEEQTRRERDPISVRVFPEEPQTERIESEHDREMPEDVLGVEQSGSRAEERPVEREAQPGERAPVPARDPAGRAGPALVLVERRRPE